MKLKDFYYDLPKEYIAQDPLEKRDESKLLIIDKNTGRLEHKKFYDIIDYLNLGDTLVLNETKVIPARLLGQLSDTNKPCEIFLVKRISNNRWECLVKPGKKLRIDKEVVFGDGRLKAKIIDILGDGNRIVEFIYDGIFEEVLDALGETPLPPYITHKLEDKNKYQTVYARVDGSVAAPTAGLHFTKDLLDKIKNKGVNITKVLLHVSLGTFRPVHEENIEDHNMHSEFINVTKDAADIINTTNSFPKGRFSECKKCRNEYNKKQLKNNHVRAIQYLGGKCAHCGYDKYICALDIHHIDPSKKDKMFAHHAFWSWKRLKKELENCILLCSNCHRAFHSGLITQDNLIST